ncbi:hypothetical protein [Ligilactobacillus animalis]|nr:hypothetical protein [Ligilactobacillus animalis]
MTVKLLTDHLITVISIWLSDEIPLHPSKFSPMFLDLSFILRRIFFSFL